MNLLRKLLIVFFILFPNSNSFGATSTMTHVQTVTFDDGNQTQNNIIAGIEFNKDGTKLFTSSANFTNPGLIMEFNLSTPYDISSRTYAGDGERCVMTEVLKTPYDLEFNHDGTKLFVATRSATTGPDKDKLVRYDNGKKITEDAKTYFKVLDKNSNSSLIEMKPITGRKHQLRKQLFNIGHSIYCLLYTSDAADE